MCAMIDPRLQAALDAASTSLNDHRPDLSAAATTAVSAQVSLDPAGADVPGPDAAPDGPYRNVSEWLSVDSTPAAPAAHASPWFTVSHWHWLAAKGHVRQIPVELGLTFPHLFLSEGQIANDLTAWEALDGRGEITEEAAAMFAAVSGAAELTLYGTVLLYAYRREPVELPAELKEFGLEAAVRNVPRVTFSIGVTEREVVTVLVNNGTVIFDRRRRRGDAAAEAAQGLRKLLDPADDWKPYPLPTTITLPGEAVDALATSENTAGVIDSEPGEDATDDEKTADIERRERVRKGVRRVLVTAKVPADASAAIADIATATTDALAQVTVRTNTVDVPRGEPSALAIAFLRGKGVVASYPAGTGRFRRVTYVPGTVSGIATGIAALRRVAEGC